MSLVNCFLVLRKQLLILLSFVFLVLFSNGSFGIGKESYNRIVDQNLVLNTAIEIHLTAEDSAIVRSSISLSHVDAWLFFDNIKPSEVILKYSSFIKIGASSFTNGGNGRIAIYGNGAVVMPHGSNFKPLTVYTEENFEGDSASYELYTLFNNLGEFLSKVKSFKLKRGYQTTFASNPNGMGYSRVFIADKHDVEVAKLQPELYATINFIRVFKHQWVTKKGKAGWDPNILNGTVYYDWNIGGSSSANVEYAVIRQNAGWPSWSAINAKENITHLLGFNEPDRPDQSNMTMENMIGQWPAFMQSGLRVGSPAWSSEWNAVSDGGNLFDFIDQCDALNYRVDFVALHCYWVKSPSQWYNDLKYIHERTGRPLWITEWNNGANWTTENWPAGNRAYNNANAQKQLNDIKGILEVLDTTSFVERYFIYDWVEDCRAMVLGDTLTLAGKYYAEKESPIGYNSKNDVVLGKIAYDAPVVSYRYLTQAELVRLSWTNPNAGLARAFRVERKSNNSGYETIYESDDISSLSLSEPLDSTISGRITYRVGVKTIYDNYVYSNEISYYQLKGSEHHQVGNFPINNTNWSTFLFSSEFESTPMLFAGVPSFGNVLGYTHRFNSVGTQSFKLAYKLWDYQSSSSLTKDDYIGALALDSGNFDLGGLQAEANLLTGVNGEWRTVTFKKAFDQVPAVFASQVSNSGLIPTIVSIQNVTNTGFEVKLSSEEALRSSVLWGEKVNYLAVEPGKGVIGDKRITVAVNNDGVSSSGIKIDIPVHYGDPVLFGSLQSKNDNFSSVLRQFSAAGKYTLFKQREVSGNIGSVKADKVAWMVVDVSENQEVSVVQIKDKPRYIVYPNPAKNVLNFNFSDKKVVEVYNFIGVVMKRAEVINSMDISELPSGNYIVKIENEYIKIVKN